MGKRFSCGWGVIVVFIVAGIAILFSFALIGFFSVFPEFASKLKPALNKEVSLSSFEEKRQLQQASLLAAKNKTEAEQKKNIIKPALGSIIFNTELPSATSSGEIGLSPKLSEEVRYPYVVLISEILLGQGNTKQEFVELFNPGEAAVDLTGWQLRKKTASGNDSVLVSSKKFFGIVPAKGYFLISHPDYQKEVGADLSWSSAEYGISLDNTVYLLNSEGEIVDKVGWGKASDYETSPALNPEKSRSLSRLSGRDTDNNRNDFVLSVPTPNNSSVSGGFKDPLPVEISFLSSLPQPTKTPLLQSSPFSSVQFLSSPSLLSLSSPSPLPPSPSSLSPLPSSSPLPSPLPSFSPPPLSSPTPTPVLLPSPSPSPIDSLQESPPPTAQPEPQKLLIIAVQIEGEEKNHDFVKLYNPNSTPVNLNGYRIVKRTKTGRSDYPIKSWNVDVFVPAFGYHIWANNSYTGIVADSRTSYILAPDNAIAIRFGKADEGFIVDSVGWGSYSGIFCEGVCGANPEANQVLHRKESEEGFIDTDNNQNDFEIRNAF